MRLLFSRSLGLLNCWLAGIAATCRRATQVGQQTIDPLVSTRHTTLWFLVGHLCFCSLHVSGERFHLALMHRATLYISSQTPTLVASSSALIADDTTRMSTSVMQSLTHKQIDLPASPNRNAPTLRHLGGVSSSFCLPRSWIGDGCTEFKRQRATLGLPQEPNGHLRGRRQCYFGFSIQASQLNE
jgi:hypothetical protein